MSSRFPQSLSEVPLARPERETHELDRFPRAEPVSAVPDSGLLDTGAFDSGSLDVSAARLRWRNPAELVLAWMANAVWAVVGVILWLPLLARTLVISVVALVHGALTGQKPVATPQRIRRASRFYTEQFLQRRHFDSTSRGARISLRLLTLFFEVLWAGLFYGALLWAAGVISVSPRLLLSVAFSGVSGAWEAVSATAASLWSRAPGEIVAMSDLGWSVWTVLGLLLLLAHLTGWWLASKRRG